MTTYGMKVMNDVFVPPPHSKLGEEVEIPEELT